MLEKTEVTNLTFFLTGMYSADVYHHYNTKRKVIIKALSTRHMYEENDVLSHIVCFPLNSVA